VAIEHGSIPDGTEGTVEKTVAPAVEIFAKEYPVPNTILFIAPEEERDGF